MDRISVERIGMEVLGLEVIEAQSFGICANGHVDDWGWFTLDHSALDGKDRLIE